MERGGRGGGQDLGEWNDALGISVYPDCDVAAGWGTRRRPKIEGGAVELWALRARAS